MANKKKKHVGWIALPIILIILALPFVTAYVYLTRYAIDVSAIRLQQQEAIQTASDTFDLGSVTVFYSPARVYELVTVDSLNAELEESLHGLIRLEEYALEPGDGVCVLYLKGTLLGSIPVTARIETDITAQNGNIGVWTEEIQLGTELALPIEKLGLNRSVAIECTGSVLEVHTSAEGIFVTYRFLQDHFETDILPDSALWEAYDRYCPHASADDTVLSLWKENGSVLNKNIICREALDRDTLLDLLALSDDASVDNFFFSLSSFEKENLFPCQREEVTQRKQAYWTAVTEAYQGLTQALESITAYSADKTFYLAGDTPYVKGRRLQDNYTVDVETVMEDCSLIHPAESRFVLFYVKNGPVALDSTGGGLIGSLEAKELAVRDILLRNKAVTYAPGLVTRFAGDTPCLLYRDSEGNTVINTVDEETYEALMQSSSLVLLDAYQWNEGTVYAAPSDTEDMPGCRFIDP